MFYNSLDADALSDARPYSARHNYTRGVTKCANFFLAPPGSTKNEIEEFWHMEIVVIRHSNSDAGVIIRNIWFSGRKSRSVNIFPAAGFGL